MAHRVFKIQKGDAAKSRKPLSPILVRRAQPGFHGFRGVKLTGRSQIPLSYQRFSLILDAPGTARLLTETLALAIIMALCIFLWKDADYGDGHG